MEVTKDNYELTIKLNDEQHARLFVTLKDLLDKNGVSSFSKKFFEELVENLESPTIN